MSDKVKKKFSVNKTKNSDDDRIKKQSNKSDTFTEEEDDDDVEEAESKPKTAKGSQSENTPSNTSTERRSSRIMTRKQRDSEVRLQFAKKLKSNIGNAPSKESPRTPFRYGHSDFNTSDSETPTPAKPNVKKPLLVNKRKSSLEYNKNRKQMRLHADTTTDDNEDTEESDHKTNTAKRKPQKQNSELTSEDEFTDETDEDELETDSDSDFNLERDLEVAISTKFPSFNNNHTQPIISSTKKGRPSEKSLQNRPNTISNVANINRFANNSNSKKVDSLKIFSPKIEKNSAPVKPLNKQVNNNMKMNSKTPAAVSPKAKSEFDKLVDELFENETMKKKNEPKKPELMLINNEPTDVYTLSIDDTLDDEDDLENLESLCEEVYEDDIETPKPFSSAHLNSTHGSLGAKHKIIDINQPIPALKKPYFKKEHTPAVTNNKPLPNNKQAPPSKPLTKTLVIPKTPTQSTLSAHPAPKPTKPLKSETSVDYKEKYGKLHASYEALSRKIAQYMEKTKKEKEQLKRQLRIEKTKSTKAQEDLDTLKQKFKYLMKNKPSMKMKK